MPKGVTDRDKGYKSLKKGMAELTNMQVVVGIRAGKGDYVGTRERFYTTEDGEQKSYTSQDRITIIGMATVHEYGSSDGHVPARPFLGPTIDNNRAQYLEELEDTIFAVLKDEADLSTGLGLIGLRVVRDVQQTINVMTDPPLAPSTIESKGSSALLIDTGRMIQSIDYQVRGGYKTVNLSKGKFNDLKGSVTARAKAAKAAAKAAGNG